ncbi:ATP-binding cassette sub-family A member 8-A [Caerostris extrusa]|uniref:ATP-binding cassette sub-family A member 8-A n=1 Tax=Caerostris extrusa TaxID=172846 RepID=A0AAV4VR06_CAEEX|nr:ATP-binding cassette sub-family A member 8-A [Caerostris extrusa]
MSFNKGEIFALMGSNGAGKSTLMKLLSQNIAMTSGEIFILDKCQDSISYCDEENIIWPNLTIEEHLYLFAILNGILPASAKRIVESLIKELDIEGGAKLKAKFLSGGYKRKLCVILSLLGKSRMVLLDEPTTGIDPVSKQRLWKRLHQEFSSGVDRTLILTTHSSNEAEVNCSRIGLFMDGFLRCAGTSQELKDKFSKGYELTVKLSHSEDDKLNEFIATEIPEAIRKGQRGTSLQYYIPRQSFKLMSELFTSVSKIQSFDGVEDCFIRECSLDQIILDILEDTNFPSSQETDCAVLLCGIFVQAMCFCLLVIYLYFSVNHAETS